MIRRAIAGLLLVPVVATFGVHIAETDPLSPEEQQKLFKLPPGFDIQLVVSEPDIGQPMNLNFDARGRLWITHSVEYPFPAVGEGVEKNRGRFAGTNTNAPRDRLTIAEGIGSDGKPNKILHFVDGLNIPIGQTPLTDGSAAVVYGIPAIELCTDKDGDGKAEHREVLYSGFGNRDTHGMANSFTRWIDGWIYGCHGFSNQSNVKDRQGRVTTFKSGNTYRFREDGSQFEFFTHGQVNPFGMTFDPFGNLYDADCHSMPVYLLLRGANYPSFGSRPQGVGFGPKMIDHNHGSTGICGPAFYAAEQFPPAYRDHLFLCNPVSEKVHLDELLQFGSTLKVKSKPDFITCDDKWFRPVDVTVGPDGALYVADFYNAIIGHYEAPLNHPRRDRVHGRVWRVVYTGEDKQAVPGPADLTQLSTEALVARLGDSNLEVRRLATNLLVDHHADSAVAALRKVWHTAAPEMRAHGLWVLERLGAFAEDDGKVLVSDPSPLVRVHLARMLAERAKTEPDTLLGLMNDPDPMVQRAAADALGRHVGLQNISVLVAGWEQADPKDTHLIHVIRMALHRHFEDAELVDRMTDTAFSKAEEARLIEIAALAKNDAASIFMLLRGSPAQMKLTTLESMARQIGVRGDSAQLELFVSRVRAAFPLAEETQWRVLKALDQPKNRELLQAWFADLAPGALARLEQARVPWERHPLPAFPRSKSPFGLRERQFADGRREKVIDSIVHGETLTGIYRSQFFKIPERLTFWICGHNGLPGKKAVPKNYIRLVVADTGEEVARQLPPRSDIARKHAWDLKAHAGKQGRIEIVDGDNANAYAWIGVADFEPPVVSLPAAIDSDGSLFPMIANYRPLELLPRVQALIEDASYPVAVRRAAMDVFQALEKTQEILPSLGKILNDGQEPMPLRIRSAQLLQADPETLEKAIVTAPTQLERTIALAMCGSGEGAVALSELVVAGKVSARVLQDHQVFERFKRQAKNEVRRITPVLKALPSSDKRLANLIRQRRATYQPEAASLERGKALFTQHCFACHQVGQKGGLVGPQLDGIGHRGIDRLLEDILDPNRNVDTAFLTTLVTLKDGTQLSGLLRETTITDITGKETAIRTEDIETREQSNRSLMPPIFGDVLKPAELNDLLRYLSE